MKLSMNLSDFDLDIPDELIALRPVTPRSASRLMVAQGAQTQVARFDELMRFLNPGDVLVLNDTSVLPSRLRGERRRGPLVAGIEVTLMRDLGTGQWQALAKPARKLLIDDELVFADDLRARVVTTPVEGMVVLEFAQKGADLVAALTAHGAMPLPPYIAGKRAPDAMDHATYQTVFAARPGAVAAPTASLHFDAPLLASLEAAGIEFATVTLHVGAGTFLPVKVEAIADHKMHAEWGEVSEAAAATIGAGQARGARIIPVGTTALRLIETASRSGQIAPWTGDTDIFITPGFEFKTTSGLITNFHLPKSTLLMLVAALVGFERMKEIYALAVAEEFRFFSYGDASLLLPNS